MKSKFDDLETAPAHALAAAVAAKTVSALELTEAAIARIERLNPPLNAVVVKDYERARQAARQADDRVQRGERGALLGVPMTVKDSHNVAGLPTTWGFAEAKNFIPALDSVAVARLKAAGAIILGKTNVSAGLADWQSVNKLYGRTNNPRDLARTPGGSSGGGAAAVAAGIVPLEFGSDIGGSIRVPASFCGICGHKPSYGLVPTRGHAPPHADGAGVELGVVGPLARTAEDLALALGVVAGPDEDQAVAYRWAPPAPRHSRMAEYRVLILDQHPAAATSADIRAALDALARDLSKAGASVSRASPLLPDLGAAHRAFGQMLLTIISRGPPGVKTNSMPTHDWFALLDRQFALRRQWRALFAAFDVVVCPAFGVVAFQHMDEPDWGQRSFEIDGKATAYRDQSAWPGVATFPGLPATALPIGETSAGLPIGAQAIGPYLEDATTIEFARLVGRM